MIRPRRWKIATLFCLSVMSGLSACALSPVDTAPPERPTALAPVAGAVVERGVPVRFSWRAVAGAQRYEFHVFDRASGDIERHYLRELDSGAVCRIDGAEPLPVCAVELVPQLPDDDGHAWRVRAGNNGRLVGVEPAAVRGAHALTGPGRGGWVHRHPTLRPAGRTCAAGPVLRCS